MVLIPMKLAPAILRFGRQVGGGYFAMKEMKKMKTLAVFIRLDRALKRD